MKNFKLLSIMLIFAVSALLSVACNKTDLIPTDEKTITYIKSDLVKTYELGIEGKNYALVGDTILPYQETKLHPLPSTKPDLNNISNNNGTFRYLAIGASLTSGVKDGGWSNDGMLTSYPNLISRQMVLSNFKQPLFNDKEFNGYGLKLLTSNTETPVQRFKAVSNNLAIKTIGVEIALTPFEGAELDNFAVPNLTNGGIDESLNTNTYNNTYFKLPLRRIVNNKNQSILEQIQNTNASFFSIEYYLQDIIRFALSSGIDYQHLPQINYPPFDFRGYTGATDGIIGILKEKGLRNGVMLNIPNILNFPYFKNCINFSSIKVVFDRHRLTNKEYGYDINDDWVYMPNASLDSLFTYQNDKAKFLDFYLNKFKPRVLLKDNRINILQKQDTYNKHIEYVAKKYSISVVDINLLYEKVGNGTLVSDDGKKVTEKEFFSSDGLYPNAYGQAIIANECIKTINAFYKTKIELINTDFYLKK